MNTYIDPKEGQQEEATQKAAQATEETAAAEEKAEAGEGE